MRIGPLPDPEALEQYDRIVPNGAERIMQMAENQAAHSHEMERSSLAANIDVHKSMVSLQRSGQVAAVLVVVVGLSLATYAALNGHDWFGGAVATGCIGGIVASLLSTREKAKSG